MVNTALHVRSPQHIESILQCSDQFGRKVGHRGLRVIPYQSASVLPGPLPLGLLPSSGVAGMPLILSTSIWL
jgi:hypothetical protein